MKLKFPKIVAAVQAREKAAQNLEGVSLWDIGSALVEEVFRKSNRIGPELKACAQELKNLGFKKYTESFLSALLDVTEKFPVSKRRPSLSVNMHIEAGNPEMMDWIFKCAAQENVATKDIGLFYIRDRVKIWSKKYKAAVAKQHDDAKAKAKLAEAKKLAAKTAKERAAAEAEAAEAEKEAEATAAPPAMKNLPAPTDEETPVVLRELSLMIFAHNARDLAQQARKMAEDAKTYINDAMPEVSRTFIEAATEACLEAANDLNAAAQAWRAVSEVTRKTTINKRGHLAAVV